jgi:hypothetical protein
MPEEIGLTGNQFGIATTLLYVSMTIPSAIAVFPRKQSADDMEL